MSFLTRWHTGNPIFDGFISTLFWLVVLAIINKFFLQFYKDPLTEAGAAAIIIYLIAVLYALYRIYKRWHWATGKTAKHLKELKTTLKNVHPGVRPLLAYIAKESAAHLIVPTRDKTTIGEEVTLNEYVRLLEESICAEKLIDACFISKLKPSAWGDCNNIQACTDIQKLAWDYFAMQEQRKKVYPAIKMRRFLAISEDEFKTDLSKENFIQRHKTAKIDLFLLPPNALIEKHQGLIKDMAIFWTADFNGWVISTDLDDNNLASNKINVSIEYRSEALLNTYSDFMREVLSKKTQIGVNDTCNEPTMDFLERINVER